MVLEICADSVESSVAAQRGGAQRVELCMDLAEGGITPSAGLIARVRARVTIDVFVMIRPRGGDFCYSDDEFDVMREDIRRARGLGADGLVLGVLDEQARVDVPGTQELVALAGPLPVTFHRAIDMTPDPAASLEDVIATGAARVLTSGGAPKASQGLATVARMVESAAGRITVMTGGGISPDNIASAADSTGATEFHASLRTVCPSPVRYHRLGVEMGAMRNREYLRYAVLEEDVRALADALLKIEGRASARSR